MSEAKIIITCVLYVKVGIKSPGLLAYLLRKVSPLKFRVILHTSSASPYSEAPIRKEKVKRFLQRCAFSKGSDLCLPG